MKTGFAEHLFASLSAAVLVFLFFPQIGFLPPIMFILGSAVPDIDHPKSIPRKFFRLILFFVLLAVFLASAIGYPHLGSGQVLGSAVLAFILAIIVTLAAEFLIPRHRGIVHSIPAGLVFGAIVLLLASISLAFREAILLGLSGFAGFLFHLLTDFVGDRV